MIPRPPRRTRVGRFGETQFWWMEFFDVMRLDLERAGSSLVLINKETGEHIARGASYMELNELALKELDNIFEKNVLLSE